jgi:LuxR family maltose regulon positive regulatory protein
MCKHPVVWIVGPAGAGKTTLVTSFVTERERPCVWYQLDATDRDVAQLFEYLPHAFASAFPRRKPPRLPRFGPESLGGIAAFTRRWFEALFATLPERTLLVFDNYQDVAADATWHETFRAALATIPEGVTVVVVSRADPPAALARMAANGNLQRLGWDELQLTGEETRGVARVHAHELETGRRERVHELAGGWVAGLLLLLEQETLPDVSRRDPASQALFDYFAAEILDRLEPDTRTLLLRTAIVSSVDGALAGRLCPEIDAPRVLSRLCREGLFTEYRGDDTYQYHPLFRTFLVEQCERMLPAGEITALRSLAATHLAAHGRADEAIELSSDAEEKARLIEREAPGRMMQGRGMTVAGWIEALPPDLVEARPWLLFWKGVCLLGFAPLDSLALTTRAFERFRDPLDPPGLHLAWATAVQAIVHAGRDFASLAAWIARFPDLPPCPVPSIEARLATGMLMALTFSQPGAPEARTWADRALGLARGGGDAHRLVTGGMVVVYHSFFGEHERAASVIALLRDLADDEADPLAVVTLRQAEAMHAWISGHDDECLAATELGLRVAERSGILVWNDQLCAFGASAAFSNDDYAGARPFIDRMAAGAGAHDVTFAAGNHRYHAGMEAFARGDMARAEYELRESLRIADVIGYPFARSVSRIALAQLSGRQGRTDDALAHLAEGRAIAERAGAALLRFGAALVGADLALAAGRRAEAAAELRVGLRIARERGYFNYWISRGATARLAVFALEEGIETDHVKELVRRRKLVPETPPLHVETWPWRVRIHAFGVLDVEGVRGVKGAPRRLLQAIIALARPSTSHESIAGKLWPDAEGDATRGVFDTTLYRLRKLLPDNVLELEGGRVAIDSRVAWLDVLAFEQATEDVLRTGDPDPERTDRAAERMFRLYRAPLFGDDDEAWMTGPRDRLHERFLECVERLAQRDLSRGALEAARATYARGLEVDAAAERLHRGLIACLVRLERRGEAAVAFERCRRELRDRLGVEPDASTRRLVDDGSLTSTS